VDEENQSGSEVPLILKLNTKRKWIVRCVGRFIPGKHLVSTLTSSQTHQETSGDEEVKSHSCQKSNAGIRSDILTNITIQKRLPNTGIRLFTVSHLLPVFKVAVVIYDVSTSLPSLYSADVGCLYL